MSKLGTIVFKTIYAVLLAASILILWTSCATCPGAQNLAYPRYYKAQDLMKYTLSQDCMISKTDSCKQVGSEWRGTINSTDEIIFLIKNDELIYFRMNHHADYEEMREIFGKYISFFELYGMNFRYIQGFTFTCVYLTWDVQCNLNPGSVQIVCTRKG
jgi:hypothetical protein